MNEEQRLARNRYHLAYYHAHREKYLEIKRKYDFRTGIRRKPRLSDEELKNRRKKRQSEYYLKNKVEHSKKAKIYRSMKRETDVEEVRLLGRVRMNRCIAARKSFVHPEHNQAEEKKIFFEAQRLTKLTGELYEVDHIIPLVVGGCHHHLNLQVLPRNLNRSKSCNPFWEHEGFKSWRDVPDSLWPENLKPSYFALMKTPTENFRFDNVSPRAH